MVKICLLITGIYRDFKYSIEKMKKFYNFENNDYDVFYLMFETEDVLNKKNEIKQFFGSKLKYLHNEFDYVCDKNKYYKEEKKLEIAYRELGNSICKKYGVDFYIPSHNIIKQFLKISKIQQIRKEYSEKNNIKYDCIIRARCDLCMLDNDYYVVNGPYANCKLSSVHYNNNIISINDIFNNYKIHNCHRLRIMNLSKCVPFSNK